MNMPEPQAHDGDVPSPCIGVCRMNVRSGLCEGCQRSIDEIARWSTADNEYKRAVWTEIERRRAEDENRKAS